ncbi:MAG: YggU family protein [Burkholderiales bacterium]|nr:YggU family protein [Burkholderiales bacterium]
MSWYSRTAQGWRIAVHVQPGAKKSEVAGLHGERLKIRVAAPPLEGRANEALIAFLAEKLALPRARVRVAKGGQARTKLVEIDDPNADPGRLLEA